jgi:hypothetical protein
MNDNLIRAKGRVIDGWPILVAVALYWVALVIVALTWASAILVV